MTRAQIVLVVVVVVVLVALAVAGVLAARRRARSAALRNRFGGEYDRTVQRTDDRREAERLLAEREQQARALELRPLPPQSRERYRAAWQGVQTRFVDAPEQALSDADGLVADLMAERGFPVDTVDVREDLLSVEHTRVVEDFRAGHAIEQAVREGRADTEQVRRAMLHFRDVFEDLLGDRDHHDRDHHDRGDRDRDRDHQERGDRDGGGAPAAAGR